MWGSGQLCEEELLGVFEKPPQGWLDPIFGGKFNLQGIQIPPIFVELIVEVGSCAPPR